MQITIIPASTRVGTDTIRYLLASPESPTVIGYYRKLSKVPEEFSSNPNFIAKQGDVEDASSLDFSSSDAVLSITPIWHDGRDVVEVAKQVSHNVRDRLVETGTSVKKLVILSSLGAQYTEGTGAIATNHAAEQILGSTPNIPQILIVRPVYFMENWITALETLNSDPPFFYSTFTPSTLRIPHIAIKDIALSLSRNLLSTTPLPGPSPHALELHGPTYSVEDVQAVFSKVLGKEVRVEEIPKEAVEGFYKAVFSEGDVAKYYADMNNAILEGGKLHENPEPTGDVRLEGETGLEEVVRGWFGV
ncbi:hypothetical protein QBC38DRAFT_492213 [Podospora fimiseda]|uniref:NAD(P)-binding domain-containing protein n=1 Tax=Podospora fimiseda TaxID=252190 RepID=A0AAN6YMB2_9PEZI|nr:hypothetical protein QBC38DRAFT_492213 [Podospora fimiseda]